MAPNRFKTWWLSRNGYAKTVTVLCAILILQIGVCFSPLAEPVFSQLHILNFLNDLGVAVWEAIFCCVTALALLVTLILWSVNSSSADEKFPGITRAQRDRNAAAQEKSGDRND
jgi:hypothetical protein